ncbi:MAG TPA: hypothetical protein ENI79_02340, partial [Rhodospirillales bacterium]|nr:hypothetical protein [Rhodospirillales bacterium]
MTRDTKDNKPKSSVAEDDPLLSQPPRGGGGGCIPYEIFDPVKVPQEWVDEFDRFETPGDIVFQSRNKIDVGIRGQNLDFKNLLATPSRSEKGDMVGHINGLRMTGHIPTGTNGWRLESANTNAEPQRDPETGNIILRASGCEGGPSLVCNKTLFRHSYILATPCATIGPVRWAGGSYGCGVFKHARCNNIIPRNPIHIKLIASREWIGTNGTHWGQVVYGCCGLNCRYNIRLALVFFLEDENRAVDRAIYGPVNFSQVLNSDHCLGNWASIFRWGPYPPIGDHRQLDVPVDLREFGNQSLDRFKRRDPTQAEIDQYGEGNIEQVIYILNGNGTWYNLYWPDEIGSMLDP